MRPIAYALTMLAGSGVYVAQIIGRPNTELSSPVIGLAFMLFGAALLGIDAGRTYFSAKSGRGHGDDVA